FLSATSLRDAPVVAVSSVTLEGIPELMRTIEEQVGLASERRATGIPVLPVDRVFTVKGFGTVVTGTLARGSLAPGMDVEILPSGTSAKIRNIQVHDTDVQEALAGLRTAVNLQGVSTSEIERGQWVAPSGVFRPTKAVDARVTLVGRPPKSGIRMHIGTAEVQGTMSVHASGEAVYARVRLKRPVVAAFGDRFILRSGNGALTVAGGVVLNPHPKRRFSLEVMEALCSDDIQRQVEGLAVDAGVRGLSKQEIEAAFARDPEQAVRGVEALASSGRIVRYDATADLYVHRRYLDRLEEQITAELDRFHAEFPASPGMPREHLRSSVAPGADAKLFHKAILNLAKKGAVAQDGPVLARSGFRPGLESRRTDLGRKIAGIIDEAGFEPPRLQELAQSLDIALKEVQEIVGFLSREGLVVKVKDDIHISRRNEETLRRRVREFLEERGSMTPVDMKDVLGVSRKYAIPYLEYLDRIRFTLRVGDVRRLASAPNT
ncbi:MAG TPA: SelB C-terminal domain-containing protein, partial [Deltaproteobacteria bacterium]|nr:SelB C-terminal domain-containing protein [Deltaproteobacteria bacterium]